MIGLGIAGLIVAFIVFAELYSIRSLINQHFCNLEYTQGLERLLRNVKYDLNEQNDALAELIKMIEDRRSELSHGEQEILNHAKYIASKQLFGHNK